MFGRKKINVIPVNAFEAFEGCPNRKTVKSNSGVNGLDIVCPKYPDGERTGYTKLHEEYVRENVAKQLGCLGCSYNRVDYGEQKRSDRMEQLHPSVAEECSDLFSSEHYSEAALRGFMTVRDRLREITGHEKATDAFGKGGLRVEGSPAEHLDNDFQQAAKLLMMSIDMFRNVGAHGGRFGTATGSETSYELLTLSSIAMHLLEDASSPENQA